jgi:hypothetical protein
MNLISAIEKWKLKMNKKQEQAQRSRLKSFDYLMIFQEVSSSPSPSQIEHHTLGMKHTFFVARDSLNWRGMINGCLFAYTNFSLFII